MKLPAPFHRLPLTFDTTRLREEVEAFPEGAWRPHPQRFEGNSALILISRDGEMNDLNRGPMLPTPHLEGSPYLRQVMGSFDTVVGRARLMRLAPGARVPTHVDTHYYWHRRVRVHVPVVTHPDVLFTCGGEERHLGEGEAWLLDTWRSHGVRNESSVSRIHLVFDTVGTAAFWTLMDRGDPPAEGTVTAEPRFVPWDPGKAGIFPTERHNLPAVMPPEELAAAIEDALDALGPESGARMNGGYSAFLGTTRRFVQDWRANWAAHGDGRSGIPVYTFLQRGYLEAARALPKELTLADNGQLLSSVLRARVGSALHPDLLR